MAPKTKKKGGTKKKGNRKVNSQVPAKTEAELPAEIFTEEEEATGLEGADRESFAIPFLALLQKGSPQCDSDNAAFMEEAKPGDFINTASGELFDGEEGVCVIPCAYSRRLLEWRPMEDGGGFVAEHLPDAYDLSRLPREGSRHMLDSGNYLQDTRQHWCLLLTKGGPVPIILSLKSTQIRKSKLWMTAMRDFRAQHPTSGKMSPVKTFANVWRVSCVPETRKEYKFKGVLIEHERLLDPSDGQDAEMYMLGRTFNEQVTAGVVRAEEPVTEKTDTDDVPF